MNINATFESVFSDTYVTDTMYEKLPETTFAEKIYKIRKSCGLTQKQFAKKCGIGYSSLCKYETGYKASEENIAKICEACKIKVDYFKI